MTPWASVVADAAVVVTIAAYVAAAVLVVVGRRAPGRTVAGVGLGVHGLGVVARGLAGGHLPWADMHEFSLTATLVAVAVGMWATRSPGLGAVLATTLGAAAVTLAVAVALAEPATPLVPALDTHWLAVHTSSAVVASAILTVAAAATAVSLWRQRRGGVAATTPTLDPVALVAWRVTAAGFLVWTFALVTGAVWAEEAWGRYWGWDPKETAAFVTWVLYAAALHARATPRWRARRAAWVALAAHASLLVTYYVVNLVVVGLHSYA